MGSKEQLLDIDGALNLTPGQSEENHKTYGNIGLASLLGMLGLTRKFVRAEGCYVWDSDGKRYLDFLAGDGFQPRLHSGLWRH